jgi:hypothetical protein
VTLQPLQGIKHGANGSICFFATIMLNSLIRSEQIVLKNVVVGTVFVFFFFGLIGMFTDKFGIDVGDA